MILFKIYFTLIFTMISIIAISGYMALSDDGEKGDMWFKILKISGAALISMVVLGALAIIWI